MGFGESGFGWPAPAVPAPMDPLEEISRRGELLARGEITQEEFAAQKARLLDL